MSIPPKAFSQLSRLEVLRLDNNNINVLEDQACAGLVSLKKLSLANNQLVALPPELFSGNYFHAHRFYCQRNGLKPLISSDNQVWKFQYWQIFILKMNWIVEWRLLTKLNQKIMKNNKTTNAVTKIFAKTAKMAVNTSKPIALQIEIEFYCMILLWSMLHTILILEICCDACLIRHHFQSLCICILFSNGTVHQVKISG